ncbi:SDR family oxidoreductase [Streptomyces sp. 110]|uniref:SDR family oxidoreductase n=1 Tax=Streptomyces endocoffeicus TaxID=2898945 RepID=A0ABS1Q7C5_9ACTN|nr:SDR family oxidoreductase [Streptomyces endocoffeicus]MBL1119846.1 SDR family oxidoreductase [Streptomyces endocoffeicus]
MRTVDALVTGGTGFIGRWLLPELTADGQRVAVLMRGESGRLGELRSWVDAHKGRGDLLHPLPGDLAAPGLRLNADDMVVARTARTIFHLGAAMSFGLPDAVARDVNVEGSLRVAELAADSPRLQRLVLATGFQHRRAPFWMPDNKYHDSKLEADTAVREYAKAHAIPLTVVHPGPVVGDSRTGETTQFWGWPDLVKALWRGRLPVAPGGNHHWMPLVAVNYVAGFIAGAASLDETVGQDYWLLHDSTPPLGELIAAVAGYLGVSAPTLHLPMPLVVLGLRSGLSRWTGLDPEALVFIGTDRFPVADAVRLAEQIGLTEPDPIELACTTTRFLLDTDFGAKTSSERPHSR